MAHRGLELVEQAVVAVKGLDRAMLVVGSLHPLVKRGQRNAHSVAVETHSEDVTQHHDEAQTHHEGRKSEAKVWLDVILPKRR